MKKIAVIPARLESTRLKKKLLLELDGKSIVQNTYEKAAKAKLLDEVWIATDSQELVDHCKNFTDNVMLTSDQHQSGSDRVAEMAEKNPDWDLLINVQGDEPFVSPADIDKVVEPFMHDPMLEMASLFYYFDNEAADEQEDVNNSSNVKVVTDLNNRALYFSRSPIPYPRQKSDYRYKKHLGIYAYKRETLLRYCSYPRVELEISESLEQLRALANGIDILMVEAAHNSIGIDTQEDYELAKGMV
jgi:3-deoxy-manno-octulosonate cytidylyltransferase (CMP-KDO synthetase)